MEGIIDPDGFLSIKRGSKFKKQYCPYDCSQAVEPSPSFFCGDWCPLFGEPYKIAPNNEKNEIELPLCQCVLIFQEFEDKRT